MNTRTITVSSQTGLSATTVTVPVEPWETATPPVASLDARVRRMRRKGKTPTAIAAEIGIDQKTVKAAMYRIAQANEAAQ